MKCVECGKEFEAKTRKCELCSKEGEPLYHLYSEKCDECNFEIHNLLGWSMKANNGSGNIERDEWETPQWLFDILHKQYKFIFDCCATEENTKCSLWSEDDFLDTKKNSVTIQPMTSWMNPPFSKALEMFRHFFKVIPKGVAIYRCDNFETKIWQEVIFPNASWVFIPNKRIAYEGRVGGGSRFPSALIGFNVPMINSLDGVTLVSV